MSTIDELTIGQFSKLLQLMPATISHQLAGLIPEIAIDGPCMPLFEDRPDLYKLANDTYVTLQQLKYMYTVDSIFFKRDIERLHKLGYRVIRLTAFVEQYSPRRPWLIDIFMDRDVYPRPIKNRYEASRTERQILHRLWNIDYGI